MNTDKTFFWNVDTQKDFMNSDGSLYVEGAEDIKPTLEKLTQFAKENNIKVVSTRDWHYDDSEELSDNPDFVNTFPPHCMANTDGVEYIEETQPEDPTHIKWDETLENHPDMDGHNSLIWNLSKAIENREIVITKDKFDVFSGNPYTNEFAKLLKQQYSTVVVYGVAENVCVDFAVKGLLERGFEVFVVEEAIKGLPGIPSTVNEWKEKGARIISYSELENIN